ncbi:glutathione peroxidase [Filobacillus milosensis]|uniref:Glutathione peroxidase n=1 Tax=Filobacillus milosensis TaxID=94137 RepID=A0A4Y8IKH5_9BACI|nr:glutathione peroxidase [Filobacillus milosensis]TFB14079.1 glutathione peroxidase [Filobacillus milosensis]
MSLYDVDVNTSGGQIKSMSDYKGHILLIVNTASKCGFTPQFEGLQELYEEYNGEDFYVLGFPCDQFMNQEFENQDEIMDFCQTNYGVTFPMFQKVDVKGENQSPLFEFLTEQKKGFLGGEIKWNFTKFLVDREGRVLRRYAPQATPQKIRNDIDQLIKGS